MVGTWRHAVAALGAGFAAAGVLAACLPGGPGVGAGGGVSPCGGPATTVPGPSTTIPETPATTLWGTPSRPGTLVAVADDGALVTVEPHSGDRLDVLAAAPRRRGQGAVHIAGVTLSADGGTAWYDVRPCHPGRRGAPGGRAGGRIYAVATDGSSPPRPVAAGTSPEADPQGGRLAYLSGDAVVVRDLATGTEQRWTDPGGGPLDWLAWAGDGADLVWVRGGTQLVHVDTDAPGAQPADVPGAVAGPGEVLYAAFGRRYELATVLAGTGPDDPAPYRLTVWADRTVERTARPLAGGVRDGAVDVSGHWGLWVDHGHNMRWSVGGGTGLVARGYLAADW